MAQPSLPPSEVIATKQEHPSSPTASFASTEDVFMTAPSVVTDFSSSAAMNNAAKITKQEEKMKQGFRQILEYVAVSEETQKLSDCFVKTFPKEDNVDWTDWTGNHYFRSTSEEAQKKKTQDKEVFLTAYDYDGDYSTLTDARKQNAWLKIGRPWNPSNEKPTLGEKDFDVRRYLGRLLREHPQHFHGCDADNLEAVIPFLKEEHIPKEAHGMEHIRRFMFSAVEHNKGSSPASAATVSCYERLFECAKDMSQKDLLVGFGHVRTVYDSSAKRTMVNGSLFEVPVDLDFREGADGSTDLWITPVKNAQISLNVDVMTVLNAIGTNTCVMNQFTRAV